MNADMQARWADVVRVLDRALELPPEVRPDFVERTCSGDPVLRAEVDRLLRATASAADFLEGDAAADAAPLLSWVARQGLARGTRFGPHEILGTLGRGGMATVYLALDHKHRRRVAVKVLHTAIAAAVGREWFLREIETAAALHHPHILPLHDSGEHDGLLYYVMPYVEGETLRERLVREGPLPLDSARRIAREVAGALDHAHRRGVVHRDIKPENILLQDGQAIVADFGIACAVATGAREAGTTDTIPAVGTPAYMSPEQAAGADVPDGRTDVYALGCVLYEMLAGVPPFDGSTVQAILEQHAAKPVPSLHAVRPDVPPGLDRVIMRALQKSPVDRFPTAGELVDAIDVPGSDAPFPPRRRAARRAAMLGVVAVAFLAIGTGHLLRRPADAAVPSQDLVAVLPFRTSGASPELAWLHDGLVDLLSIRLGGEGRLRAADPASVLGAWHRLAGTAGREPSLAAMRRISDGLGAGRVVEGDVVGTAGHLSISASLHSAAGGPSTARASEAGPADSLPVLMDRLAGRLLALDAGVEPSRLAVTSASLPATRAFIAGRAAFRRGNFVEAAARFRDATAMDTTFALAALELVHASVWVDGSWSPAAQEGKRLAQASRSRLSPGDQALLDAWDVDDITMPQWIHGWEAAARANPDRAEVWYELGDAYHHLGLLAGLNDPFRLASDAFQRGWAIDSAHGADPVAPGQSSIVAEPLVHMVEIAQMRGGSASVGRLVAVRLAGDSTSATAWYLRWHRAIALGDSALRAFWADSSAVDPGAWGQISEFATWTGIGTRDLLRATNLSGRLEEAGHPGDISGGHATAILNGGRPGEGKRLLNTVDTDPRDLAARIQGALYWGTDARAAADAVRRLGRVLSARSNPAEWRELQPLCAVSAWRAAHRRYGSLPLAIRRLRAAVDTGPLTRTPVLVSQYATLCSALLDATLATALRRPDAEASLARADAAARTYPQWSSVGANLVIARAAEELGDLTLALRALRRRGAPFGEFPLYLSTFLREEGRLAALTGDTVGAVRAYRRYLALHPNPEPEAKPEISRVQTALGLLATQATR